MSTAVRRKRIYRQENDFYSMNRYYLMAVIGAAVLIIIIAAALCIDIGSKTAEETVIDEHEGQVYLYDGFDWIWMTPLSDVPVNGMTERDFMTAPDGTVTYISDKYDVLRGIDVSEHQKDIDWAATAASGIDYAYIRVGRRGYTEGGLYDDPYFKKNIKGCEKNGIKAGVYMFSQAVTTEEAVEEANFLLERIKGHNIDLPVVFDWEKVTEEGSRTIDLDMPTRTDCAIAFCETVKAAGFVPCIYFNRNIGYYGYDLSRLTDYEFWFSLPESGFPNFYYAVDMWQYSFTDTVPGIGIETDMNLRFIPRETESEEQGSAVV